MFQRAPHIQYLEVHRVFFLVTLNDLYNMVRVWGPVLLGLARSAAIRQDCLTISQSASRPGISPLCLTFFFIIYKHVYSCIESMTPPHIRT